MRCVASSLVVTVAMSRLCERDEQALARVAAVDLCRWPSRMMARTSSTLDTGSDRAPEETEGRPEDRLVGQR